MITKDKDSRKTQAERTALSDQRMFDSAIALINERGTQKTTLKDIGENAGYSRGLANYRFGSKDGLMLELFTSFDVRWKEHLGSYLEGKTGINAVHSAVNALRDFLKQESDYLRAMYLLWYECLGHDSEMRNNLAEHHNVYRKDAKQWIEEGMAAGEIRSSINAEQFAAQYCAFIFGIIYQWLVNASAMDLDAVFDDYQTNVTELLKKN